MKFYMNDKKVSKKEIEQAIGAAKVAQRIQDAKETWAEDPHTEVSWMDGMRIERD